AAMAATWLAVTVAVVGVGALAWGWVVVGRSVRSWGYAERADDLLVTRGVLNRQLVVVPYGRMQFVDVTAGPLDRRFGLATVQLRPRVLRNRAGRVRLDRLEAVDVVRPLVARALGLAELRLEVAGGGSSEAPLAYLSEDAAQRLRAELLARAAGLHHSTPEAP